MCDGCWPFIQETAGILAVLLVLGNAAYYLWMTVTGRIRPHAFPYLVWTVVTTIVFAGMWAVDSGAAAWRTAMMAAFCAAVGISALRNGLGYIKRVDVVVLVMSLLAIPLWIWTQDPDAAIFWLLVVEILAAVPALRKAYDLPWEDSPLAWGLSALGQAMCLVALPEFRWSVVAYFAVWSLVCWIGTAVMLLRRR